MNYYKRHLGDYARDTGHLSALEHGIYTLLLDWYYINECPIPDAKAKRIARGNPEETQTVLSEFFTETPEGWRHARADREIAEYQEKAERNREAGKLGGRPKKTQTVSERNPDVTLATSHKPLAIKEEQERGAVAPTSGSKSKAVTLAAWIESLDGEAIPSADPLFAWAASVNLPREWIALAWWVFEGRYTLGTPQQRAKKYTDWRAAFRDHVQRDFLKLWAISRDGDYFLTTTGKQAEMEMRA